MKLNPKVYTDAAERVANNPIGCCIAIKKVSSTEFWLYSDYFSKYFNPVGQGFMGEGFYWWGIPDMTFDSPWAAIGFLNKKEKKIARSIALLLMAELVKDRAIL